MSGSKCVSCRKHYCCYPGGGPACPQCCGEQKAAVTERSQSRRSGGRSRVVCLVKSLRSGKDSYRIRVPQLKRPFAVTISPVTEKRVGESAEQQIFSLFSIVFSHIANSTG